MSQPIVKKSASAIQKTNLKIEGLGDEPVLLASVVDQPVVIGIAHLAIFFVIGNLTPIGWLCIVAANILAAYNDIAYLIESGKAKTTAGTKEKGKPITVESSPVADEPVYVAPKSTPKPGEYEPSLIPHAVSYQPPREPVTVIQPSNTVIQSAPPKPVENELPDVIGKIAERLQSTLIIGVPGAGKGMVLSHLIRRVKRLNPEMKIIAIDPKNDPKETGYWNNGFDHVFRRDFNAMQPFEAIDWLTSCIDYFKNLPRGNRMLVIDEWSMVSMAWSRFDKKQFEMFVSYLVGVASSGNSMGEYVIAMGQIANASDMGMTGGSRGIFKPFAILSNHDRSKVLQFCSTKFVSIPDGGADELYRIMDKSPVGRAWFSYQENRWLPMPKLENLSGYDRDSRQWLTGKPEQLSLPMADSTARIAHSAAVMGGVSVLPSPYPAAENAIKKLQNGNVKQKALGELLEWLIERGNGFEFSNSDVAKSPWAARAIRSGAIADRKQSSIAPYLQWLKSRNLLTEENQKWKIQLR